MGKTARWFRGLLTGKSKESKPEEKKKRWSFVRSSKSNDCTHTRQPPPPPPPPSASADLRRGSYRDVVSATPIHGYSFDDGGGGSSGVGVDPNKHAIAVAAATAAVAEAAVAAAQAAAAVVKLTSSGRSAAARGGGEAKRWDDWAAVVIQSAFRGYLAKRALRALKGLVKLQALVRGHIMRKKTVDTMRRMQALVRVQARARAGRSKSTERRYLNKQLSHSHLPGPATPEKYEHAIRSNSTRYDRSSSSLKRNGSKGHRDVYELDRVHSSRNYGEHCVDERQLNHHRRRECLMRTGLQEDEKSDKIVEIDPGKPQLDLRRGTTTSQSSQRSLGQDRLSHSFTTMDSPSKDSTTAQLSTSSASSGEVQSMHPRRFPLHIEDDQFCTAENSPQFYSVSSRATSVRRSPFTPAKSDCSGSLFSGYSDHPNYMSNTESSRAKVRSQSAPKQRLEFEKSSSTKRSYIQGFNDVRSSSVPKTTAALQANFARKAYPGSGRLDRLGMPIVHSETIGSFNGT
ncbi:hypothetical protein Scep_006519 [Stephania cephalantha]|uniref:DUF4005 domain-containing protein n=1 Tax=Stephania cephalantha TaxID=152367 RepID=A0AAP0K8C0_9MAGN